MAYIGPLPAETFTSFATQEFSTSATTSYTLDHPVTNENELALFINNVRQQPGSGKAYTAVGTALTLSAATASTDTMYAVFLGRALQTVNPADASVGTSQLAATSVTAAKLNTDIISGLTALAEEPASTDEFLVSDGGTIKRIDFSHIKGGGGLVPISTVNITSNTASAEFTSGIDSTYDSYVIKMQDLHPEADNVSLSMTISTNGGSSYVTSSYVYAHRGSLKNSNLLNAYDESASDIRPFNNSFGNANAENGIGEVVINKPSSSVAYTTFYGQSVNVNASGDVGQTVFGALYPATTAVDAVKFAFTSGNIERGRFTLYGVANS